MGQRELADRDRNEALLDSSVLLQSVLNRGRSYLMAFPEREMPPGEIARYVHLIKRRAARGAGGIFDGEKEFWSLAFKVSTDTLIPRPETETLVERILALSLPSSAEILDLGTGTAPSPAHSHLSDQVVSLRGGSLCCSAGRRAGKCTSA